MEVVNMRNIMFLAEESHLRLSYEEVRLHFRESVELLYRYSSHQDALSILITLQHRLAYFQLFAFPPEDINTAHVEFEQHRQFYSGMENIEADLAVMNSYRNRKLLAPDNLTKRDSELLRLERHKQELYNQGLYQRCLEVQ